MKNKTKTDETRAPSLHILLMQFQEHINTSQVTGNKACEFLPKGEEDS